MNLFTVIPPRKEKQEATMQRGAQSIHNDLRAYLIARQHYPAGLTFGNRIFAPDAYF
jgi:hypothetical protein